MTEPLLFTEANYEELAGFLATFPNDTNGEVFWRNRFHLWWEGNPSFAPGIPRGWVLRGADRRITGFLGNVPHQFSIAGTGKRVFCSTTWRVLPEHRGGSIRLVLAHIRAGEGTLLFNTTTGPTTVKVFEYLRFRSIPSTSSGRTYLLPIAVSDTARAYLRDVNKPAIIASVVAAVLKMASLPSALRLGLTRSSEVCVVERAGAAFDSLWERTSARVCYTSVRTAEQINWICFGGADQRKTLLGYFENGVLRGFSIFCDARWRGLRVFELFDVWTESPAGQVTLALFAGAYRHANKQGYDLLAFHDYSQDLTRTFRRAGLVLTTPDNRRHFYGAGDATPPDLRPDNSYLSGIEGDLGL
jgi:hypothetical protein